MAAPFPKCTSWTTESFPSYVFRASAAATTAVAVQGGIAAVYPPAAMVPAGTVAATFVNEFLKTPCTIPFDMGGVPAVAPAPTQ